MLNYSDVLGGDTSLYGAAARNKRFMILEASNEKVTALRKVYPECKAVAGLVHLRSLRSQMV